MPSRKRCSKCGKSKPLSSFSVHPKNKDGRDWKCKECTAEYYERYASRQEKENPSWKSDRNRRTRYKLTQEELEMWLQVPICQHPHCTYVFQHDGDMHFDHHPTLGHVRGVLCAWHNKSLRCEERSGMDPVLDLLGLVDYYLRDKERHEKG
jgi:hypothetical protein